MAARPLRVGAIYGAPSPQVKDSPVRSYAKARIPTHDRRSRPAAACSRAPKRLPSGRPFTAKLGHMRAILDVILIALQLYVWLLILSAILSWLLAFNVVNARNQVVATVWDFLYRITEPALRPIRNLM